MAWTATDAHHHVAVYARTGSAVDRLGPVQTLARDVGGGFIGTDLVAAAGPGATAAIEWLGAGPAHSTRAYVALAARGGRFGAARLASGHDTVTSLNGIGITGSGAIVAGWNSPRRGGTSSVDRYAAASPHSGFSPGRTLTVTTPGGVSGQVVETSDGAIALTSGGDVYRVTNTTAAPVRLPVPPHDEATYPAVVAAGPGGELGTSLASNAASVGGYFGADIGVSVLAPAGAWSTPTFIPGPAGPGDATVSPRPVIALPDGGGTVLGGEINGAVVLATAPADGALAAREVVGHVRGYSIVPGPADPHLVAFGADAAMTWTSEQGAGEIVHVAVQPPGGTSPRVRTLGSVSFQSGPSLAGGAGIASAVWPDGAGVRLWFARASSLTG